MPSKKSKPSVDQAIYVYGTEDGNGLELAHDLKDAISGARYNVEQAIEAGDFRHTEQYVFRLVPVRKLVAEQTISVITLAP